MRSLRSAFCLGLPILFGAVILHGQTQTPGTGGGTVGITGKWTFESQGRGGGSVPQTMNLKQDGNKLTGTIPSAGRGGSRGGGSEQEISNGKVENDHVFFEVKREFGGNTVVTKYDGTLSGDELKLKITRETPNGPVETEVTAKKATT